MKFCGQCTTPLALVCPNCHFENPPGFKFCGQCTTALGSGSPKPQSSNSPITIYETDRPAVIDGERKTVTALFVDIRGSTELMEDLDPEEARAMIDPALKLMIEAVRHYDGYIVQSTGDGVFALFGAPLAYEDHPQRALYAALRLQEAIRRYSSKLIAGGGTPLEARVGINTGEVVVRTLTTADGHTEYTPIGHTANLASRMQAISPTGSIAITEHTRRLVEGYFQLKSHGPTRVKGLTERVEVYEVTGLGPLRTRLQRAAARGLTKFVGRQREMETLKHAAELAQAGRGQIVAVMADPGVGKSRLFYEFKAIEGGAETVGPAFQPVKDSPERLAHMMAGRDACPTKWMVLEALSVSHGKASAYLPVLELLSTYFEISRDDDERKRREHILGKVLGLDRALEDTLPYLYSLHGVADTSDALAHMDPQIRRRRTLEAIKRIILRESLNQPLMVIFEDLHWIDAETQALLNLLVDAIANARVLLLVNYRPEYRHEWGSRTHYTQLRLDPLGRESAEEMLDALLSTPTAPPFRPLARSDALPLAHSDTLPLARSFAGEGKGEGATYDEGADLTALKRLIIERTDGSPFFMEEMVQSLFEEGVLQRNGIVTLARPMSAIKVPATVQAVLASRIDRLASAEKELLQTLAVLGREFTLTLVQRVWQHPHPRVTALAEQQTSAAPLALSRGAGQGQPELEQMLSQLQLGEFINEQPAVSEVEYAFKHALTQEVAYNSMLIERRKALHERTGEAIESLFADRLGDYVTDLAHHYDRSGNLLKAIEYLGRAGQRAAEQVAHSEVMGYVTRALELIERLPDGADRARHELELQITISRSLNVAVGPASPECEKALARALGLCEQLGDNRIMEVMVSLGFLRFARSEPLLALQPFEQALAMAEQAKDADVLTAAHAGSGWARYMLGQFEKAREHLEVAIELSGGRPIRKFGQVSLLAHAAPLLLAFTLLVLGYPITALKRGKDALDTMRQRSEPFINAIALGAYVLTYLALRDIRGVEEQVDQYAAITAEHEMPIEHVIAAFYQAWLIVDTGRVEEGLGEMRLSIKRLLGAHPVVEWLVVALAEICGRSGLPDEGLNTIKEALTRSEKTPYLQAEFYRLKGELTLLKDPHSEAEAERCLRQAIDVARLQAARLFELRATTSLARLLAKQGYHEEAHTILSEIYNWFTEGFDTRDLKEAKALLDELSTICEN